MCHCSRGCFCAAPIHAACLCRWRCARSASYSFPGNVMELENLVTRLAIAPLATGNSLIDVADVRRHLMVMPAEGEQVSGWQSSREEARREMILKTIAAAGGNRAEAARRLGMTRRTLAISHHQSRPFAPRDTEQARRDSSPPVRAGRPRAVWRADRDRRIRKEAADMNRASAGSFPMPISLRCCSRCSCCCTRCRIPIMSTRPARWIRSSARSASIRSAAECVPTSAIPGIRLSTRSSISRRCRSR